MSNPILGIDPGKSGGFAWINGADVILKPMPTTDGEIAEFIKQIATDYPATVAHLEVISGFAPKNKKENAEAGGANEGGNQSTAFKQGDNYGYIRACCYMAGLRLEKVHPVTWQRTLGLSCSDKKKRKKYLQDAAQRLFPQLGAKVTQKVCDALLIAESAKRAQSARAV